MKTREQVPPRKDRLDAMLDEPSRNQRYGGMTMREMVRKVVLRRDDQAEVEPAEMETEQRPSA